MGKTWELFGRWFEANEQRFYCGHFDEKQIAFAAYCEGQRSITAKLQELVELLEAADDEIFHSVDEYTGQCLEGCLSCRIEAALKATLEEQ